MTNSNRYPRAILGLWKDGGCYLHQPTETLYYTRPLHPPFKGPEVNSLPLKGATRVTLYRSLDGPVGYVLEYGPGGPSGKTATAVLGIDAGSPWLLDIPHWWVRNAPGVPLPDEAKYFPQTPNKEKPPTEHALTCMQEWFMEAGIQVGSKLPPTSPGYWSNYTIWGYYRGLTDV